MGAIVHLVLVNHLKLILTISTYFHGVLGLWVWGVGQRGSGGGGAVGRGRWWE